MIGAKESRLIIRFSLALIILLFVTAYSGENFAMSSLNTQDWKKLFNNPEKLTEFATTNNIIITDESIESFDISGIKLVRAEFNNTHWKNIKGYNLEAKELLFKNSTLESVLFPYSKIETAVFENVKFNDVSFVGSTLKKVTFINCKINNSRIRNLIASNIIIKDSTIQNSEFFQSELEIQIIDSEVKESKFYSLKPGSSVILENTSNIESNYQRSQLKLFRAVNSKIIDTTIADSEIDKLIIDNSYLDFSSGRAIFNEIIIKDSEIPNFGAIKIKANKFTVSSCKENADISFAKSQIKEIRITDCDFSELYPIFITSDSLIIENSTIAETAFVESKIKDLTLKNITFTKEADFSDIKADNATIENITKGPNLKLIMDGANIEF